LITDGAPALALGVDPPDEDVMQRPPRPVGEGVITARMWRGIFLVGVVVALGTLFVLDWAMPGGFFAGTGDLRYAQTMAFTTLMLFQLFNVFAARSDERSAFRGIHQNRWLWGAVGLSLALQALVLYTPVLQQAFGTTALSASDWLHCAAVASSVLWITELRKFLLRWRRPARDDHGQPFLTRASADLRDRAVGSASPRCLDNLRRYEGTVERPGLANISTKGPVLGRLWIRFTRTRCRSPVD
jgi:Ca2+-transporting ATPase